MRQSTQHLLDVIRPPRVQITYDVEIGGAVASRELPYVLGILADLSGQSTVVRAPLKNRKFVSVAGDTYADVMASIAPRVVLQVADLVKGGNAILAVDLTFNTLDDFEPAKIIARVPALKSLMDSRTRLNDLLGKLDGNEGLNKALDGVVAAGGKGKVDADKVIADGNMVRDPAQAPYAKELIQEFLDQASKEGAVDADAISLVSKRIAALDSVIGLQLDAILHAPAFQKLEASWRGLFFLVTTIDVSARIQVRLLNITKSELAYDLEKAIEFDQSQLFKKVYEEEYGTFGGAPFSVLMGDFEFGRNQADLALLVKVAQVASAAHAPFISAANPNLFDLDSFTDLGTPRDLSIIFENTELGKWQAFRESEDSRYVALTLPHILMRAPYGENSNPAFGVHYEESVDGTNNGMFCWGNAAWALAQRVMNSAMLYGWPAAIRGVEGGGLVEDLPYYTFKTTDGDVALKCPTEVAISDRREKELSDLGFLPLCHCKNRDYAAFFGSQTAQKPQHYNLDEANSNANLSARLSYILAASRFAHYIKAIMRDKIGSFMNRGDVERYLNKWISQYVLLADYADQASKVRLPLREARVDVMDVPGKPGSYKATVFLRPHFQLEELTASIRLVASLPRPALA
jgi:type VI secretion system protein ImpC